MTQNDIRMGLALNQILISAELYATNYQKEFGSPIGTDYVLGPAFALILKGFNELLNGPLGKFEGGRLSKSLYHIARDAELLDENGEIT